MSGNPQQMDEKIDPGMVRRELGLTKAEMARLVGLSWQSWSQWEQGVRSPTAMGRKWLQTLLWLHRMGLDLPGMEARKGPVPNTAGRSEAAGAEGSMRLLLAPSVLRVLDEQSQALGLEPETYARILLEGALIEKGRASRQDPTTLRTAGSGADNKQ